MLAIMSKLALGPTQTSIQWVLETFPGVKWLQHEADHSPPSSTKVNTSSCHDV